MELEGSLKAFSLPEIMQFLAMSKMTGTLHIRRPESSVDLMIRNGKIVNSSTMQRSFRLGDLMVYKGEITRRQLSEFLQQQKDSASPQRLGEMFLEHEILNMKELQGLIRMQMEETVFDMFDWDEGDFNFENGDPDDYDEAVVEIDIEPVLIEGTRRTDEWARITQALHSDDLVPKIEPLPDNFERDLSLTKSEWRVLSLINGYYPVGSIVTRSTLGRFETYRILNTFYNAGLIDVVERKDAAPRPIKAMLPDEAADAKPAPEPARTGGASQNKQWAISTFFGGSKTVEASHPASASLDTSPPGLWCAVINEFVKTISQNRDFGSPDPNWIESLWRDSLDRFPAADLIFAHKNQLYADIFEKYYRKLENSRGLENVLYDCAEALRDLFRVVFRETGQRIGERQAAKIFDNIQAQRQSQNTGELQGDFSLRRLRGQ